MRKNKNTFKIILALAVAFLATVISYSAFSGLQGKLKEQNELIDLMQKNKTENTQMTYTYAVATSDLKAGEIVSEQDVDFKEFDVENSSAFDNRSDVANKVLLHDISAGDAFTSSHIAKISSDNLSLREGYRALTLPADNFQGKSTSMNTGSYVDIYNTSSDTPWFLENVRIISIESSKKTSALSNTTADVTQDKPPSIMDAEAITFEVDSGSISDFISHVSQGKLVLVTRGAGDRKIATKKRHNSANNNYSASAYKSLPNLPKTVPISNFSGLPEPIAPMIQQSSVEVIEANVKSKVTFD